MAAALINSSLLLSQSKPASSNCRSSKSGESRVNIPMRWHHLQLPLHGNMGSCCTAEVHHSRKALHRFVSCLPSSSSSSSHSSLAARFNPSTRLFVSGLSFRTTEESLKNAFKNFGSLVEVNLVMDEIANRPRGFAFLRYAHEEQSKQAIEGMHGKFLDGRVIFVEYAKPRSQLRSKKISGP